MGGFKSVIAAAKRGDDVAVVNCAGRRLHDFLPKTRPLFDQLREEGRMFDLEWEDSDTFIIEDCDVLSALQWSFDQLGAGRTLLVNCAQGKSRSGCMVTAYIMVRQGLSAMEALGVLQRKRPFAQPNSGFMRQLEAMAPTLRAHSFSGL